MQMKEPWLLQMPKKEQLWVLAKAHVLSLASLCFCCLQGLSD